MIRFFFLILLHLSLILSNSWIYDYNNPWDINKDSRSSALGGIDLNPYFDLDSRSIHIFNSNMFNNIINYNNIYYKEQFDPQIILGNTFEKVKIGFLNRSINNIKNTSLIWDSQDLNEPVLSEFNYDLIDYYDHRDIALSIFLPFTNSVGDFGLDIKPSFLKIDKYSAKSISLDLMYFKEIINGLSIMLSIDNLLSYRKWSNNSVERFYPELQVLTNVKFNDINFFIEIDNMYTNYNFIVNDYDLLDNISLGIEHFFNDRLNLRIGSSKYYNTFGFGLKIGDFIIDYSYLEHEKLDFSNQFSITYLIKD